MAELKFILAGGGTSGHINPALAIAARLKEDHPDCRIRFLGTGSGLESRLVPEAGYQFTSIRAKGLPAKLSVKTIQAVMEFLAGRNQCRRIMQEWRPDAVVGTGGYVCSPVVSAAAGLKIPVLLHEQNALPGRSNRLMARKSGAICISFPGTEQYFPVGAPVVLTGNPVRPEFFQQEKKRARQILNIPEKCKVVLAIGGSLGANSLNQAVAGWAGKLAETTDESLPTLLYLSCGRQHYARLAETAKKLKRFYVMPYIDDIHHYMAAADLMICRSGAGACFELAALGRPSILVPYPFAAGDHQTYNARYLADQGGAIICPDAQLSPQWLKKTAGLLLLDESRLEQMGQAASRLARPDAAQMICSSLYKLLK